MTHKIKEYYEKYLKDSYERYFEGSLEKDFGIYFPYLVIVLLLLIILFYWLRQRKEMRYVSSLDLLKSCTFYPTSKEDTQYLSDMLKNGKNGMSIYVYTDKLEYFVNNVLPNIKHRFVLVSGESDLIVPYESVTKQNTELLLNHSLLIRWFAQNNVYNDKKLITLPIGIDRSNQHFEKEIQSIKQLPVDKRIPKIYANFSLEEDRFLQRKESLEKINPNLIYFSKSTDKILNEMSNYSFVLSPFGNGIDCHRTWEALCLGCIVIVMAPDFKEMFRGLPVINVDRWEDVTDELLKKKLQEFKGMEMSDKLRLDYWSRQF
jgi:hypothetical protein